MGSRSIDIDVTTTLPDWLDHSVTQSVAVVRARAPSTAARQPIDTLANVRNPLHGSCLTAGEETGHGLPRERIPGRPQGQAVDLHDPDGGPRDRRGDREFRREEPRPGREGGRVVPGLATLGLPDAHLPGRHRALLARAQDRD